MGNFSRVFIAVVLIISLFTVSVFATPTGSYDLYSTDGRVISGFTSSGNTYIANFSSHLAHIQVYLNQILSYNANISTTIDYYLPALLQRMVDAFSPAAGDNRSMWQLSSAMVSGITAIQSAALGIAQDVYNISTYVDGIETKLDSINNHEYNIEQYNNSIQSQLTSIINNFQFLESINWVTLNSYNLEYSYDNIDYYTLDNLPSVPNNTNILYLKLYSTNLNEDCLINLFIPFYLTRTSQATTPNIEFYYRNFNYPIYPDYFCLNNFRSFNIFVYPYNNIGDSTYPLYLKIDFGIQINKSNVLANSIKYLNTDSVDFYTVDNFIQSHKQSSDTTLSDIKNILIDIDNNSDFIQNNNDLQINVDIDPSVGQGVTGVISKIQDLLDFGVSLQEFLVVLNQFDNLQWFTRLETYEQVNYDPRTNLGYQDLYD